MCVRWRGVFRLCLAEADSLSLSRRQNFGASQDIDFEDAPLLEQYQAPIAAALTPAFAADSYPEVIASAIQVCAVFVGSGVTKEIDKMGRILKLLTTALESCKGGFPPFASRWPFSVSRV